MAAGPRGDTFVRTVTRGRRRASITRTMTSRMAHRLALATLALLLAHAGAAPADGQAPPRRPGDTPDTLDYDTLARVGAATALLIEDLAG